MMNRFWGVTLGVIFLLFVVWVYAYVSYRTIKDRNIEQTKVDYNVTKFLKTHCKLKAIENPFMFPHGSVLISNLTAFVLLWRGVVELREGLALGFESVIAFLLELYQPMQFQTPKPTTPHISFATNSLSRLSSVEQEVEGQIWTSLKTLTPCGRLPRWSVEL